MRWSVDTRLPHGEHSRDRTAILSSPMRHISLGVRRVSYARAWNSRKFRVRIVHSVISNVGHIITSWPDSNSVTKLPDWRNRFACAACWGTAGFVAPAICWVDKDADSLRNSRRVLESQRRRDQSGVSQVRQNV